MWQRELGVPILPMWQREPEDPYLRVGSETENVDGIRFWSLNSCIRFPTIIGSELSLFPALVCYQ